jgi:TfoX/Sxy family transcriptional regulator of competence genes
MFGGVGLYAADVFFGILAADTLYFKVDAIRVAKSTRRTIGSKRR